MTSKKIIAFLICFFSLSTYSYAQVIFNEDKPELELIWNRVGDFTNSLRSVESAEFSPDGKYVISGSKFGYNLMLWRVTDGYLVWEKVLDTEIEAVTFSPDGKNIALGDEFNNVTVFDLDGNIVQKFSHDAAFDGITWSPDGKYLAGGSEESEKGEVAIWNTENWQQEIILDAGNTVNSLQFSKDSNKLIAAGNKKNTPNKTDGWNRHGFVKAWNVGNEWSEIFDFKAQEESSKSIRFRPDERQFAVAGFAKEIKIFSFPDAEELFRIESDHNIEAIAYHPEGNFLFAGGHGERMQVYETADYEQVHSFPSKRVEYIDFSNDGRLMVTGHEDGGLVRLYMLISKVQTSDDYQRLSNEILNNKDLDESH